MRRTLEALAISCALTARAGSAPGEQPSIVLLGHGDGIGKQIEAELAAQGFRVVLEPAPEPFRGPADIEAAAREASAMGAVYVVMSQLGVEVWLVDRVTGKTLSRDVLGVSEGDEERVVAVRVVELLRATLLELELPEQTQGEVEATPQLRAVASLPSTRPAEDARVEPAPVTHGPWPSATTAGFLFDGAIGINWSVGAIGAAPLGALGAFWQPKPRVAVGLSGLVPIRGANVSGFEGSASVATWQLTTGTRIYPLGGNHAVEPSFGAGLGIIWFQIEGTRAATRYVATSEQLLVASPHLDVGVRWRLSGDISLRSSLGANYAFPEPAVQFAGTPIVTLARPLLSWTFGIEWRAIGDSVGD